MNTLTTKKAILTGIVLLVSAICFLKAQDEPMPYAPGAFGVWGWDWPTTGGDAQRSSSVKNDRWISRAAVTKPGPRLQYKIALPNTSRQMNSLSQPILVQTARGLTGFKSMGFASGSGGSVFGFDYDTSQLLWKSPIGGPAAQGSGTMACPGGMTAALARPTPLIPPVVTDTEAGRGVAPGNLPGARKSGTAVGAPGEGAPIVAALEKAGPAQQGGGGRGGSGRGGGGGGGGRGSSGIYALGADGVLHQLSMQQGFDVSMQPASFLPPNANASGLIVVDNVAYVATSNNCDGVPNGVWALDLGSSAKTIATWKTDGGNIAGNVGPAFGTDGTLYVAVAGSVVSLEPKTLKQRDIFSAGSSEFNSSPVVFSWKGRDLVAVSNRDGKLYLLDGASLKTPLATSAKYASIATDYAPGALASWADSGGTRWILAAAAGAPFTNGGIVAFRISDEQGKPVLAQAWTSRDLISPVAPVVVNGVVFALSSGEFHSNDASMTAAQRAQRSQPAVLYALDAFTGKELWNSGRMITSFSPHSAGLAVSTGQVYVVTFDNTLYAFGFEQKEN